MGTTAAMAMVCISEVPEATVTAKARMMATTKISSRATVVRMLTESGSFGSDSHHRSVRILYLIALTIAASLGSKPSFSSMFPTTIASTLDLNLIEFKS